MKWNDIKNDKKRKNDSIDDEFEFKRTRIDDSTMDLIPISLMDIIPIAISMLFLYLALCLFMMILIYGFIHNPES